MKRILFERLEYGKYCETPDGPIEYRTEHGRLGTSPGFAADLVEYANPSKMPVVSPAESDHIDENTHATVLRPIQLSSGPQPVFFRVTKRVEDPSKARLSRNYTLARFLVCAERVSPLHFLVAMNSRPLNGLTRKECEDLAPFECAVPWDGPGDARTIADALRYLMSGMALGLEKSIEEARFWEFTAEVWLSLPEELRPWLCAGWNVGASQSGLLAITAARECAANAACLTRGVWQPPKEVRIWNQITRAEEVKAFDVSLLAPGDGFVQKAFGIARGNTEDLPMAGDPFFIREEKPIRFPDFHDLNTIMRFRSKGYESLPMFGLRRWIEAGRGSLAGALQDLPENLRTPALQLIVSTPVDRKDKIRVESELWELVKQEREYRLLLSGLGPRMNLFRAAAENGDIAAAYEEAASRGAAEDLPGPIAKLVIQSLDSLSPDSHEKLLSLRQLPQLYDQWLDLNARSLALTALSDGLSMKRVLTLLIERKGRNADIVVIARLTGGLPLPKEPLESWPIGDREAAVRWLLHKWKTVTDIEEQERLLKWLKLKVPVPGAESDTLLALARGFRVPALSLADAVMKMRLPPSLWPRVEVVITEDWPNVARSIRNHSSLWEPMWRTWNSSKRLVVLHDSLEYNGAEEEFHFPMRALEEAAISWMEDPVRGFEGHAARIIWKIAVKQGSARATQDMLDPCWHLQTSSGIKWKWTKEQQRALDFFRPHVEALAQPALPARPAEGPMPEARKVTATRTLPREDSGRQPAGKRQANGEAAASFRRVNPAPRRAIPNFILTATAALLLFLFFGISRTPDTPRPAAAKDTRLVQRSGQKQAAATSRQPVQPPNAVLGTPDSLEMMYRRVRFTFVRIPKGEFMMGKSPEDSQAFPDESPAHLVVIPDEFQIGEFEVTQAQWKAVMRSNPGKPVDDASPVNNVSWLDTQEFIRHLNDEADGYHYRLPTEAEWEYAARAGSREPVYGNRDDIAWYLANSRGSIARVGTKQANAWGLFDVLGNVNEWCEDSYSTYYLNSPSDGPKGPTGPVSAAGRRVRRGGSWRRPAVAIRLSNRNSLAENLKDDQTGFRLVRQRTVARSQHDRVE